MSKSVTPLFGLKSFSCPSCGALADQTWANVFIDPLKESPRVVGYEVIEKHMQDHPDLISEEFRSWAERYKIGEVFGVIENNIYANQRLEFLYTSKCFSCKKFAIWRNEKLVSPSLKLDVEPNKDMPEDAANDFREAAAIYDRSPKGAAALLRLALQRMMPELGQSGKNINADIGALVEKGLPVKVQQALDVVRVVGNNAVHPGQIDVADGSDTALKLFALLNIITEQMLTQPRQIKEMFSSLPDGARQQIAKRDSKTLTIVVAPPDKGS